MTIAAAEGTAGEMGNRSIGNADFCAITIGNQEIKGKQYADGQILGPFRNC